MRKDRNSDKQIFRFELSLFAVRKMGKGKPAGFKSLKYNSQYPKNNHQFRIFINYKCPVFYSECQVGLIKYWLFLLRLKS